MGFATHHSDDCVLLYDVSRNGSADPRMEQPIEARGGGQDTSWVVVSSDWSVCEEIDGPASRLGLGLFGSRAGDVVSLTSGSNVVKARTRAVSS